MKAQSENIFHSFRAPHLEVNLRPLGHTPWLELLLLYVGMGALILSPRLGARAQSNYAEEYTFTTLPGAAGPGAVDGPGSTARFSLTTPFQGMYCMWAHIAVDAAGNLYVADTWNHTVRKITAAGEVSTLAGKARESGTTDGTGSVARFNEPSGVAVDATGTVYVADMGNDTIRKVTSNGVVTTLAGLAGGEGHVDGAGSAARFWQVTGLAIDSTGNVWVADRPNGTIRKVTPNGVVTTLGGGFSAPEGVAADRAGNVYVANTGAQTIAKISAAGVVTTLAGKAGEEGSADGAGSTARFCTPTGVAVDSAGTVYVAEQFADTIRKVTPDGVVTTLAGLAYDAAYADGPGAEARFNAPYSVAVDPAGNLYVTDGLNNVIRKISPAGIVTTLAGMAPGGSREAWPEDAVDAAGNVYVAENFTIRKVTPDGVASTLAGLAGSPGSADGTGSSARFGDSYGRGPGGVAVDSDGNVYVADSPNATIRKITPTGVVTTLAGSAGQTGSADGIGSAARFQWATDVAVDSKGNIYVADEGNNTIRKVAPGGIVTTFAGVAGTWDSGGSADGVGSSARFNTPSAIAVDSAGNVYVADGFNFTVRKITPGGVVTTLAGLAGAPGSADGTGATARFGCAYGGLTGIAVDSAGRIYVADTPNNSIRVGVPSCPDRPTVDLAVAPAGVPRQLDTCPQTAVAWEWSWIRRPAASTATLSSATARNPTFTPDVADLYIFQLKATDAAGAVSLRRLELTAVPADVPVLTSPQRRPDGSFQVTLVGQTNHSYAVQVSSNLTTWTDWTNVTPSTFCTPVTDPAAAQQGQRFYWARTWDKGPPLVSTSILDDFNDNKLTGWSHYGSATLAETNQQLKVRGRWSSAPTQGTFDTMGFAAWSKSWTVGDGQTLEWRVELIRLDDNATNAAKIVFGTPSGVYGFFLGRDFVFAGKYGGGSSSAIYFYDKTPIGNTNRIIALAVTRAGPNLVLRIRALDRNDPTVVLYERSIEDTTQADPVLTQAEMQALSGMRLALGRESPAGPCMTGQFGLGLWQYTDGKQPLAEVTFDNLELWMY